MSPEDKATSEFEQHARAALGESVTRVDGRVRSRLNLARQAALEEIVARPRWLWRNPFVMPATGAVAAAVLAALLLTTYYHGDHGASEANGQVDDLEMLADNDALDLVENWDNGFYEWAASESDDADGSSG